MSDLKSLTLRRQRTSGRRLSAPRPVHGTSAKIASKACSLDATSRASPTQTVAPPTTLFTSSARASEISFATNECPSSWAIADRSAALPPGPAQRSNHERLSAAARANTKATNCDPSSWTPARRCRTASSDPGVASAVNP